MKLKKSILLCLLFALVVRAQDGELTLDPNDIPLTPDPALEAPVESTITVPPLDVTPPAAADPVPMPAPVVIAPEPAPLISPRVEEVKPTPSNLEVKAQPSGETDITKKEERFNKAYNKFYKDSTSDQNWEKVVGKRTSDTYIVNKGDTLWDISGTLFGDPFYWPKVWSLNKDMIYNPHVIFPEMKIKFFQGDSKSAPTLATDTQQNTPATDEKKDPDVAVNGNVDGPAQPVEPGHENEHVKSGPKDTSVSGALKKLPSFFKDHELRIKKQVEVQIEERKVAPNEPVIKLEFYVSESPIESAGRIVEVENELKSAGDDQYVFVKFIGQPSGVYTVLKPAKIMKENKDSLVTAEIYEVEGELKILGKVNTEENMYRSQVITSNTLVSEGSLLVPGRMKSFKLADSARETTANKGRIIGNLNDYDIVGQGSFVLINQGAQSGYQANMMMPIYEDLAKRNPKSLVKENPQKVGSVVIVESTPNFSIGYVSRIFNRVLILDFVGMAEGGEFDPKDSAQIDDGAGFDDAAPVTTEPQEEMNVEEF